MITPEEYPVYNHRERPGLGRDLAGNLYYNCFSVRLGRESETGTYAPYLFSDFIRQYNRYAHHAGTCEKCMSQQKVKTYPVGGIQVDRAAVERKFQGIADDSAYYYCPLIQQFLAASQIEAQVVETQNRVNGALPAEPISAILSGNWDDEYLMEFRHIAAPQQIQVCSILQDLLSDSFISTAAERSFFTLWFLSSFQQIEALRQSGQRLFLKDDDFDLRKSSFLRFVFPIPQVWVSVIPKPPPGVDWLEWERQQTEHIPQRVDFLLSHNGKRHIVEIDDKNHYGENSRGNWLASERRYRQTLNDTRWLKVNGFEVIRFTNEEILELYDPATPGKPNSAGFAKLLHTVFLEQKEMVYLATGHTGEKYNRDGS